MFKLSAPHRKVRIGRDFDGGYVIVANQKYDLVLSAGISDDDSFERDFLKMHPEHVGKLHAFDMDECKVGEGIVFHKDKVDAGFFGRWVPEGMEARRRIFLKMDVEGAEYEAFSKYENNRAYLSRFAQIVMEVHRFNPSHSKQWINNVFGATHWVVHLHANNAGWVDPEDGHPQLVEVTLVSKSLFPDASPCNDPIPNPLIDLPNCMGVGYDICMHSPITIGHTGEPRAPDEDPRKLYAAGVEFEEKYSDLMSALRCYGRATELDPGHFNALNNIGCICMLLSEFGHAISYFKAAMLHGNELEKIRPNLAIAYCKLAATHELKGHHEKAIELAYESLCQEEDKFEETWVVLCQASLFLNERKKVMPAAICVQKLHPDWAIMARIVFFILAESNLPAKAIEFFEKYKKHMDLEKDKKLATAWYTILDATGRGEEAKKVLKLIGDKSDEAMLLAGSYINCGKVSKAIKIIDDLLSVCEVPSDKIMTTISAQLFGVVCCHKLDGPEILDYHKTWEETYWTKVVKKPRYTVCKRNGAPIEKGRKIRIGYVSGDFREHVVMRFVLPLLRNHNKEVYEIHLFANVGIEDDMTEKIKKFGHKWHNIKAMPTDVAATYIASLDLDLLVDLGGYTGDSRLDVMLLKPAPVQATMIGYPATTGLSAIDYRLGDHITDPPGPETEAQYSEKIAYTPLNTSFLCYDAPWYMPALSDVRANRDHSEKGKRDLFIFGCFAKLSKLSKQTIKMWCEILNKAPNCIIVLKTKYLTSEIENFKAVLKRFMKIGGFKTEEDVRKRLYHIPLKASVTEHLKDYNLLDACLDTIPYTGTTTTCEALAMGVPVVTMIGTTHRNNVSASIIGHSGLMDRGWVGGNEAEYVSAAMMLYGQGQLDDLARMQLAYRFRNSDFCNGQLYATCIEHVYNSMLEEKGILLPS